jgi:3-oxoacyl-[acyl-carrier protein] reductase
MIDLTGRNILIAGGSRGIGRATALMAARAGANVAVNFIKDSAAADQVVRDLERAGRRSLAIQADMSMESEANRAVNEAATLGPIWGMVVCAGIFEPAPVEEMSAEFWDRVMAINLRSTFLAVRAVARSNTSGGSIVIVTSTAGQRGSSLYSAYATSKGAQIIFMRSMAKELAPRMIRVNCVAPGWTETDMSRAAMDAEGREGIIKSIPLGRIGQPDDPAAACCFLLSDLAQFITGSTITVDGGFDMRG